MKQTRRAFLQNSALLAAALPLGHLRTSANTAAANTAPPAPAASGRMLREILFSPGNLTERTNCQDRVEPLRKFPQNPVFTAQMPWEHTGVLWGSVLRSVDGRFRFFYNAEFPGNQEGAVLVDNSLQGRKHCVVCVAESDDGIAWRRPALNLHFAEKFPGNNIVLTWPSYYNDACSVIEDLHDPDSQRRYKMLLFHLDTRDQDLTGACLLVSPDGLRWTFTGTVLPAQDACSLWQDRRTGRYYAFLKDRHGANRSRLLSHSDDFKTWSEPQWIITPGPGDHAGTHFYNQSAFTLCGHTLGFLNLYDATTQTTWAELIESGDNLTWRRLPSQARVLSPGAPGSCDSGGAYVGLAEPIPVGDEFRYYYYASADRHDEADLGGNPAQRPALAFATFRRSRLIGQQTEQEGSFTTLPIRCPGGRLFLNFACTGDVTVSIRRPGYGTDYEGFAAADCVTVTGDSLRREIVWKNHATLDALKGKYIRLKISGRNLLAYSASFER